MTRGYRPKSSFISSDPEKRARSLANLKQGREKRPIKTKIEKKPDPFSPVYRDNIIGFLEDHYCIPETKAPVKLEDWQKKKIFIPLFEVDPETGLRKYSLGLIGLPKKNSKSTMAAMIANYFLFQDEEFGEILLTANSRDQSSWIIFDKLKKSLLMNPEQLKHVRIFDDLIEVKNTGTVARIVAPNYRTASGTNPSLTLYDELWAFELDTARKFWDELTESPARKQPLALVFSYAGFDEDSLLFELYKSGLEGKDPKMFFLWEHKNLASWITKGYLDSQRKRLRPGTYKRLHKNEWSSGEEAFIEMDLWDNCVDKKHNPILPDREIALVVGVDIGITHDTCAVVGVTKNENKVLLACQKKWQPTKKNPIDLEETVEAYIKELNKDYNVEEVLYDPYQFHRSAMTLQKESINMVEFPQTTDRLTSMSQNLYDLIKGGNLVLYRDKEMKQHAQKATAKETPRGWRIVKKKASHKIDLIIALAMSCQGAAKLDTDSSVSFFVVDMNKPVTEKKKVKKKKEKKVKVIEKIESAAERNKRIWNTPGAWTRG